MTTYKDLQPSVIKDPPFANIGAHDLCSIESNWTGCIGKEGSIERRLKKFTSVHWRQYYVALSQGCVYVFRDESSGSPKIYFSLKHYKKLQRNFSTPFSFAILPSSEDGKIYRFCCRSDAERLDLMRALYVSLLVVHDQPVPRHAQPIGIKEEYDLTESEIVTSSSTLCSKIYEVNDDSSDDDGRYDMPLEDHKLHRPINKLNKYERDPTVPRGNPHPDPKRLPVVPNTTSKQKQSNCTGFSSVPRKQSKFLKGSVKTDISKQKSLDSHNYKKDNDNLEEYSVDAASSITTSNKLKPQIAPKPVNPKIKSVGSGLTPQSSKTPILENPQQATPDDNTYINMTINDQAYVQPDPKVDPSDEYMFDGDRDDAGRVLHLKPEGTFLIRPSSEPGIKVLAVKMPNDKVLSFKILTQESKVFLEKNKKFDTIPQFVEHYKKQKLFNRDVTLGQGYKEVVDYDSGGYEPVAKPSL